MEINVWQLFAPVATLASNLLNALRNLRRQQNGGALPNVPENAVSLTSTLTNVITLEVVRDLRTAVSGGVSGNLIFNGEWICFTLENPADLIQPGTYNARLDKSPHLGYVCPHLQVPERDGAVDGDAGLRVHIANFVSQLRGCVAVGLQPHPDCIEQSQAAFDKLMGILPQTFLVTIR